MTQWQRQQLYENKSAVANLFLAGAVLFAAAGGGLQPLRRGAAHKFNGDLRLTRSAAAYESWHVTKSDVLPLNMKLVIILLYEKKNTFVQHNISVFRYCFHIQ